MKDFKSYLKGFYPGQKVLLTTFDYLHKYHPEFRLVKKLEAGYAYQKIFGQPLISKSQRSNLFNTLGEIKKYLEDYLLWKETQKAGYKREKMLMDIYRERNIQPFYQKYFTQVRNRLEEDNNQDMWNEFRKLELAHQKYFYKNRSLVETRISDLKEMTLLLNGFWVNATLKYACEQSYLSEINLETLDFLLLEEAKNLGGNSPFRNNIFNQIYLLMLKLSEFEEAREEYTKVKTLIFKYYHLADHGDQNMFYGFLINYVSRQLKRGRLNYQREVFEIYKFGLESKLMLDDGGISSISFNNVIKVSCDLGELEFASMVIDKYGSYLPGNLKEDTINIARAMVQISSGKFEEALRFLSIGEFYSFDLGVRIRGLQLQCLYELEDFEALFYHLNAFEIWVKRNEKKLAASNVEACRNLIKFSKSLTRPNEDMLELRKKLDSVSFIFLKGWLIKKIEELL